MFLTNKFQRAADALGLNRATNRSLWVDRIVLELNIGVLHTFAKAGISIVDQHTISEQFMTHFQAEMKERGGCPTDWVWTVPSTSGSLTPIWHQETLHYHLSPSVLRQVFEIHIANPSRLTQFYSTLDNLNKLLNIFIIGFDMAKL